mgnify:CR=1 FL=1
MTVKPSLSALALAAALAAGLARADEAAPELSENEYVGEIRPIQSVTHLAQVASVEARLAMRASTAEIHAGALTGPAPGSTSSRSCP